MTVGCKDSFLDYLEKDEIDKQEIKDFINDLWEDYTGAYFEGRASAIETIIALFIEKREGK